MNHLKALTSSFRLRKMQIQCIKKIQICCSIFQHFYQWVSKSTVFDAVQYPSLSSSPMNLEEFRSLKNFSTKNFM